MDNIMLTKSTSAEVDDRVRTVFTLMITGTTRRDICQYAAKKWNVSDRQADRYIQKATEDLKQIAARDRDFDFGKAAARLEYLFGVAIKNEDYRQALNVEREIIDLYQLQDIEIEILKERVTALEHLKEVRS